jgi:hypothetical protein
MRALCEYLSTPECDTENMAGVKIGKSLQTIHHVEAKANQIVKEDQRETHVQRESQPKLQMPDILLVNLHAFVRTCDLIGKFV